VLVRVDFDPVGRTGEDGRIDVPLPSHRKSRLYVASEDGRRASATLEPSDESASEPMYLTLLPPFPVTGRVVDGGSGDPVPGAMVWQSGAPAGAVLADAAGRFHLDGSGDPLRLEIHAAAPGFAGTKRRLARRGDGLASETTVELQPAVWVRGSVTDGDGSPLPGVQVRATPGDSSGSPKPAGDTTWTAPDGGFLLTGLDPTTSVQLAAWAEGRAKHSSAASAAP
jgi:hypothetical protein